MSGGTERLRGLVAKWREQANLPVSGVELTRGDLGSAAYAERCWLHSCADELEAALADSPAPHVHTKACYSKVPETEGKGEWLSCGKVAGFPESAAPAPAETPRTQHEHTCDGYLSQIATCLACCDERDNRIKPSAAPAPSSEAGVRLRELREFIDERDHNGGSVCYESEGQDEQDPDGCQKCRLEQIYADLERTLAEMPPDCSIPAKVGDKFVVANGAQRFLAQAINRLDDVRGAEMPPAGQGALNGEWRDNFERLNREVGRLSQGTVERCLDEAIGAVIQPVPPAVSPGIVRQIQMGKLTDSLNAGQGAHDGKFEAMRMQAEIYENMINEIQEICLDAGLEPEGKLVDAVRALAARREPSVREALQSLANEVSAIVGLSDVAQVMRETAGNTNVNCLLRRLDEARAALAGEPRANENQA